MNELLPAVCEVRAQPAGNTAVNAELAFETADEDVMVMVSKAAERSKPTNTVTFSSAAAYVHTVHDVQ